VPEEVLETGTFCEPASRENGPKHEIKNSLTKLPIVRIQFRKGVIFKTGEVLRKMFGITMVTIDGQEQGRAQ